MNFLESDANIILATALFFKFEEKHGEEKAILLRKLEKDIDLFKHKILEPFGEKDDIPDEIFEKIYDESWRLNFEFCDIVGEEACNDSKGYISLACLNGYRNSIYNRKLLNEMLDGYLPEYTDEDIQKMRDENV